MVYWVIAKMAASPTDRNGGGQTIERIGPFESRDVASQARTLAADRYRGKAQARLEIVCDFT